MTLHPETSGAASCSNEQERPKKRVQKRLLLFVFAVLALHTPLDAQFRELGTGAPGPVKAPHLTAELIADPTTIAPGGNGYAALSLTLEPGWHVYWVYAGDSGEPPEVMWSLPEGITLGPMQYPACRDLSFRTWTFS